MFNTVGEEINRTIAEKIMGLDVVGKTGTFRDPECGRYYVDAMHKGPFDKYVYVETCMCKEEWAEQDPKICGHHAFCLEVVPDYYENIADAMKVLEKLREKYYISIYTSAPKWQVLLELRANGRPYPGMSFARPGDEFAIGDTLAQAICLAAVETVKEQEK